MASVVDDADEDLHFDLAFSRLWKGFRRAIVLLPGPLGWDVFERRMMRP